jgi:hypothetical protein
MGWPDDAFRPARLNDSRKAWRSLSLVHKLLCTPTTSAEERAVLKRYLRRSARRIFPEFFADNPERKTNY